MQNFRKVTRILYWIAALFVCSFPFLLSGCSPTQAVYIAASKDPRAAIRNYAKNRTKSYKYNPVAFLHDVKRIRRDYNRLLRLFRGNVSRTWGKKDALTPTRKRYVKYTQNYKSRAIIDFETGKIVVETVSEKEPKKNLRNAILTTLLTPDDPRSVDLYSSRKISLTGTPYLHGLVRDHQDKVIESLKQSENFSDYLVNNKIKKGSTRNKTIKYYVHFKMRSDFTSIQALRIKPLVEKYAKKYNISKSLIFAVIKTESAFNPYAVSSSPAYGLMQIVPTTAGRDTFQKIKGYDHIPSREYLFNPENNIELGTAYLSILSRTYLKNIHHPLKREYCTISAYNGGTGNVLRTFSKNRKQAVRIINRLTISRLYSKLRNQHPRKETRRYLDKVLHARKEFVRI